MVTAVPLQVPASPGAPTITAGTSYTLTEVGNVSLENTGVPLGTASVAGTGLGIDGNWLLGYYQGQWLVHNGGMGAQPTYATYALVIQGAAPPPPAPPPGTPPISGPPATSAPAGTIPLTNGQMLIVGVGGGLGLLTLVMVLRSRHHRREDVGRSVI